MKLAYLTGQYPKVSHTFIRREILGLEAFGHDVLRLSIRPADSGTVDPIDLEEKKRTTTFFEHPKFEWLGAFARITARQPAAIARELMRVALSAFRAGAGPVQRMAYLLEATFFLERLEAEKVEHLHVHFGRNGASVAQIIRRLGGPGFSQTVHGPDEFDDPLGHELRSKIADSRFTVAISSYTTGQLRRWAAIEDWSKIHVVRCSVDEAFFEAIEPIEAGQLTFVCVGRLCAQKAQLVLLDALAELVREGSDVRLVLAGDGEMREDVEARARALGIENAIEITGWISEQEVRERIRASRAMVLPSFAEGLPVVIMESLSMGRPVVSCYTAGIPELIDPENGWLVPAGDARALAEAMRRVLATPESELDAMGRRGAERVREYHFIDIEVARLDELLREFVP